jgi:hypothetical protein
MPSSASSSKPDSQMRSFCGSAATLVQRTRWCLLRRCVPRGRGTGRGAGIMLLSWFRLCKFRPKATSAAFNEFRRSQSHG